ncbi:MAG TPA: hypothetical protein VGL46_04905 [Pseudonocardiaceae bacterium]
MIDSVPSSVLAAVQRRELARHQQQDTSHLLRDHLVATATATLSALASLGEDSRTTIDRDKLANQLRIASEALRAARALSPNNSRIRSL